MLHLNYELCLQVYGEGRLGIFFVLAVWPAEGNPSAHPTASSPPRARRAGYLYGGERGAVSTVLLSLYPSRIARQYLIKHKTKIN